MSIPATTNEDALHSFLFLFKNQLLQDGELGTPQPDYLKWQASVLYADLATAYDEYTDAGLCKEDRDAWQLFYNAIKSTGSLVDLYTKNPPLFKTIARHLSFLPCLMSWHPGADRFNQRLFEFSHLGEESIYCELRQNAGHLLRQSWPVRYAYAIIATIDLTLDTYGTESPTSSETSEDKVTSPYHNQEVETNLPRTSRTGVKQRRSRHKNQKAYRAFPFWTDSLEDVRRPFNNAHVLDYWRKGKEIILEEMPNFHARPEWESYRQRRYKGGAKKGAIQHAIFKDILAALQTIAGANKKQLATTQP